ncbi:ABC transporter permease [Paenibacillus sp. N3.4]|uniref:ABC transporter permease n=1 Tax=Paenibacillus sp. N3.4 TaxID=2603222 RepID=UPI0011CC1278|nr:ABC transporter permease [Paenibacillus sp. N3.4]TXK85941.1 ABC transporter permease [Paenibacillus sp. N3.4]
MQRYLIKRLLSLLGTLFGVSVLVFLIVHLIPGDPAEHILGEHPTQEAIKALRTELGLDKPLLVQYVNYAGKLLQGNLGTSFMTHETVWSQIVNRFPLTLQLAAFSIVIAVVAGVILGVISAVKHNTIIDRLMVICSLVGISAPGFWVALLLIWIFAYKLALVPISGYEGISSLILPAITIALSTMGSIARVTRSSMLDVIKQDYMRTAEAKGAAYYAVVFRHGLKNALIPVITLVGLEFGSLLAGAVVAETVFSLHGIGSMAIEAIGKRDIATIQGMTFFLAVLFVLTNLVVDIIYSFVDPRIKYE